jgi:hypothetical protein
VRTGPVLWGKDTTLVGVSVREVPSKYKPPGVPLHWVIARFGMPEVRTAETVARTARVQASIVEVGVNKEVTSSREIAWLLGRYL